MEGGVFKFNLPQPLVSELYVKTNFGGIIYDYKLLLTSLGASPSTFVDTFELYIALIKYYEIFILLFVY